MTLAELETALGLIVQDVNLALNFKTWINAAILNLAADIDLPALRLLVPLTFPVTSTTWLWTLPSDYQKNLFRCLDSDGNRVRVLDRIEDLEALDYDHLDTGDHVTEVAVATQGTVAGEINYLGVYPLVTESLSLWYYRKPAVLDKGTDICDCLPAAFHERLIVPIAVVKAYEHLQDQVENFDPKPLQYWRGKVQEGLYGSPMGPIGLINYLVRSQGGPRRHGGRPGRDSIGSCNSWYW
jgi:hypothetical protein